MCAPCDGSFLFCVSSLFVCKDCSMTPSDSLCCFFDLWLFSVEKNTSSLHVKLLNGLRSFQCVHFINLANEPKNAHIKANTLLKQ